MQAASLQFIPVPTIEISESDANVAGTSEKLAALQERVDGHIKFFWIVVSFGFIWLGALTALIWQTHSSVKQLSENLSTIGSQVATAQLTTIKTAVETAQATKQILPTSQLVDYRRLLTEKQISSGEYWTTVAAIINYQSFVNQQTGQAPNPAEVAKPCPTVGPLARDNSYSNVSVSNCIIDLDNESFDGAVFKDSIVRYHGGKTTLNNVVFLNCRFVLDFRTEKPPPANSPQTRLLMTLLSSGDQVKVEASGI
jgi:hypothetical protein